MTMTTDYQIQAPTRRCAATGRDLQPGEKMFSVLLVQEGKFVRLDYAADAWQGPPAQVFSFWQAKVPPGNAPRRLQIDDDLLLDCFQRLQGQIEPERVQFRYVVGLLLMRRKRLKFEDARLQDGQETLRLRCPRTRKQFDLVNPRLNPDEMARVQEEVFRVLGWQ